MRNLFIRLRAGTRRGSPKEDTDEPPKIGKAGLQDENEDSQKLAKASQIIFQEPPLKIPNSSEL